MKKKTSKKQSQPIEPTPILTLIEKMTELTREIVKANEMRRLAINTPKHIAVDYGKGRDWSSITEWARDEVRSEHGRDAEQYIGGGSNVGKTASRMKEIQEQYTKLAAGTPVSSHRETLDKIEELSVIKGRSQVTYDRVQRELDELKGYKRGAEEQMARLREGIEYNKLRFESSERLYKELAEKVAQVKAKVAKKAAYKGKYSRERHVDARNIAKILFS